MTEWMTGNSLVTLNIGERPTFEKGASQSYIDVTMATEGVVRRTDKWQVLEEETLSLHNYIEWDLRGNNKRQEKRCTYVKGKVDSIRLRKLIEAEPEFLGQGESLEASVAALQRVGKI